MKQASSPQSNMVTRGEQIHVYLTPLDKIYIVGARRHLNEETVLNLADSILREDLLQPILITEEGNLVAGLHRYAAFQLLGSKDIPCFIVPADEVRNKLAEIDENLVRNPLSVLDRCELLKRLKELLARDSPRCQTLGNDFPKGLSQAIASRIKQSKRSVDAYIEIASRIDPQVKQQIANTQIASKLDELKILKNVSPDEQKQLVEMVLGDQAKSIKHAWRLLHRPQQIEWATKELKQLAAVLEVLASGPAWADFEAEEVSHLLEHYAGARELIRQSLRGLVRLYEPADSSSQRASTSVKTEKRETNGAYQPLLPHGAKIAGS